MERREAAARGDTTEHDPGMSAAKDALRTAGAGVTLTRSAWEGDACAAGPSTTDDARM